MKNSIETIQKNLSEKYCEIEGYYYDIVDILLQTINDQDETVELPMVELTEFSIIDNWNDGEFSSKKVYDFLTVMDIEKAAKKKLTEGLYKYMFQHPEFSEVVKEAISEIEKNCLDRMVKYLST